MHYGHSDRFPCILNDKNFPFALLLFSVFQSFKFLLILSLTDTSRAGPGQNAYGPQSCRYANTHVVKACTSTPCTTVKHVYGEYTL